MPFVYSDFESGSIEVIDTSNQDNIQLALKKDNASCTKQWFYFALQTQIGIQVKLTINNAGCSTFSKGWPGYRVFASYDREDWFRVDTQYDDGKLSFGLEAEEPTVYFSYFPPYDSERHQMLLTELWKTGKFDAEILAITPDDNQIELISTGSSCMNSNNIWLIARQHPGETMAQWFAEGVLKKLADPEVQQQLQRHNIRFYCIANMNPDGSKCGNHRTNALGTNLNRQWSEFGTGTMNEAPEALLVASRMQEIGVDALFDIHGDEEIPHNFAMSDTDFSFGDAFKRELLGLNSKFQIQYDYSNYQSNCGAVVEGGIQSSRCCGSECNTTISGKATDFVKNAFNKPAVLIEMSYKELANGDGEALSWGQLDCVKLGADSVVAVLQSLDEY